MGPDQFLWEATYPPHIQINFSFLHKLKSSDFHSFLLTWDPMGAKIAKHYSSHKSRLNFLKLLLNFCLQYPHEVTFWDFWNFDILNCNDFFPFSLKWGHMAGKVKKKLLLSQIMTKPFQTFPEFLSPTSSQSYFFRFLKFCIFQILWNFQIWIGVNGKL